MPKLFFDFGNSAVKWFTEGRHMGHFLHAIAPIPSSQWKRLVGRAKQPPEGYIAIGDNFFAVGDKARRYTTKNKPQGAARYTEDYYGVALMAALGVAYEPDTRIINLYASHAPRDIDYAQDIIKAARGKWQFVNHKGAYHLDIKTVETFDEPLGGYNHAVLTTRGQPLKHNPYRNKTVLVIDVGGYTCDVLAVDAGGVIDDSSITSTVAGVGQSMEFFEKELRSMYPNEFRAVGYIDEKRLEAAVLTGKFPYGKSSLKCADIAQHAINMLVNDVVDIINRMGGAANYDVVLLTGGGSALIVNTLRKALPAIDFVLVEKERELMRFANVLGASKMFTLFELLGVL